jgi:hypothetical protein
LVRPVKAKLTRFAPFASVTQAGFVNVVEGDWNKSFFEELENFDGDGKKKDDQVDVCSDAFWCLNRELQLPTLSLPTDMIRPDSFGFQTSALPTDFSAGIPVGFN